MKKLTLQQAREKIHRYCAYQERCHKEVRNKLYELGVFSNDVDEILSSLIVEGFLNEERFAKTYSGGKFRIKKWGRLKIVNALEKKAVSKNCIKSGLKEIDEDDYLETLKALLLQKSLLLDNDNPFVKRDKLSKYLIQKGYEPDLVWGAIKDLISE